MKFKKVAQQRFRDLDYKFHRAKLSLRRDGFSNGAEDMILAKYIAELLPKNHSRTAIDIGAGDGIRWSNTYALFLNGWQGVGIEYDNRKFVHLAQAYKYFQNVFACRHRASPDNIVPLLHSYEIEKDFGVLSLDIDGNDYWVLRAILRKFRPQIVVTEINEKIPPPIRFVVKYNPNFQLRHHFFGYSIQMLADLCEEVGYTILKLEYNNAFLTPNELAADARLDVTQLYREGYLDRPDRKEKFSLNFDMETIYSLNEEQALGFLRNFYSKFEGEYLLGLERLALTDKPTSV
ncbi:MAG TPA: hypothetical protein VGN86_07355 [Pyrinomonadaceae bacterium]|jgi:hypothetical protein|nr:hypothetical protein [Pyrinomonadaceae bacterium]